MARKPYSASVKYYGSISPKRKKEIEEENKEEEKTEKTEVKKMTRSEALRKCIIVFDALKRVASKGNAGLEPEKGAEEQFKIDAEIAETLREMLRELMAGEKQEEEQKDNIRPIRDWQKEIMENGIQERLTL